MNAHCHVSRATSLFGELCPIDWKPLKARLPPKIAELPPKSRSPGTALAPLPIPQSDNTQDAARPPSGATEGLAERSLGIRQRSRRPGKLHDSASRRSDHRSLGAPNNGNGGERVGRTQIQRPIVPDPLADSPVPTTQLPEVPFSIARWSFAQVPPARGRLGLTRGTGAPGTPGR